VDPVEEAIRALKAGRPVMVYDSGSREDEVDLVYYAGLIDEDKVYTLRTIAGGLICYATTEEVTRKLGIPFGDEIYSMIPSLKPLTAKRLSYGDRPAFTIWVNHVEARTGIRDRDRALTMRALHRLTGLVIAGRISEARMMFEEEFQAPGHVPVLAARDPRLRRGHTELTMLLAGMAGLEPSMVFAEMLDRGDRLSLEDAERLSEAKGIPLVDGKTILEAAGL